jgi:hypothetical protein
MEAGAKTTIIVKPKVFGIVLKVLINTLGRDEVRTI